MSARRTLSGVLCLILFAFPAPGRVTAQNAGGYQVAAVENAATLVGRVTFDGQVPRARRFMITKDVEVCGLGYRERQEVDVSDDGGLRNVVISIQGVRSGKAWPEREGRYELSQEDCVFAPHVQVVRAGDELDILNPDPVLHNVHAFELIGSAQRTLFNFGQPPEEPVITHALRPRRGREIRLECDAHDFMLGWIFAADTPYAVLADEAGGFAIDGVPPGTYTVRAWHPYLGTKEQEVTLAPGGSGEIVFTYVPE
ncbi:MAG: carboxypeptidase regulatory-like domain-containing protein [Gemmatimonadota bacterium]|nr:carboxypeptidase regulatory-like domain-containing protein [Gemmatimonadota bacterium]